MPLPLWSIPLSGGRSPSAVSQAADLALYPRPSLSARPLGAKANSTRACDSSSSDEAMDALEARLRDLHVNPINITGKRSGTKLVLSTLALKSGLTRTTPGAAGATFLNIIDAARMRRPENWEPYEVRNLRFIMYTHG
jgi:hypothetical protein